MVLARISRHAKNQSGASGGVNRVGWFWLLKPALYVEQYIQ